MAAEEPLTEIRRDIKEIKSQLNRLASIMMEKMSPEDAGDFEQAIKEYKQGKTIRLGQVAW